MFGRATQMVSRAFRDPLFAVTFFVAACFLFFNLQYVDLLGDDAHYAIRSVGYVDVMFSQFQETPMIWFQSYPWWAHLSFHDHPFVFFLIQHIFLLMNESMLFTKLPSVFAALGSLFLTYAIGFRLGGRTSARVAVIALCANPLFLWLGRTAFMESIILFFVLLAFRALMPLAEKHKRRHLLWAGFLLGLATLTKYLSLFLLPVAAVLLLLHKKKVPVADLAAGVGVFILTILPAIVYNLFIFKTQGHLDYQFSRLLHIDSPWTGVPGASLQPSALWNLIISTAQSASYPFVLTAVAAFVGLWFRKRKRMITIFAPVFFLALLLFLISNVLPQPYQIALLTPFLAIAIGQFFSTFKSKKTVYMSAALLVAYSMMLSVPSQLLFQSSGRFPGLLSTTAVSQNAGMYQLDKRIDDIIMEQDIQPVFDSYPNMKKRKKSLSAFALDQEEGKTLKDIRFPHLFVYDQNISWYARTWLFIRRQFYHNLSIMSTSEFVENIDTVVAEKVTLILAGPAAPLEPTHLRTDHADQMLEAMKAQEQIVEEVKAFSGETAFYLYTVDVL